MKPWKLPVLLYLLVVFVSGAAVGALGYRTYNPPSSAAKVSPEVWRKQYLQDLTSKVNLTTEQAQKVDGILEETSNRFHEARAQHNQIVKQIGDQQRSDIRAILTPDQLPKVDQFWQERDQRAKQSKR